MVAARDQNIEEAGRNRLSELLKKSREEVIAILSQPEEFKELIRYRDHMIAVSDFLGVEAVRDLLSAFLSHSEMAKDWIKHNERFFLFIQENLSDCMEAMMSHVLSDSEIFNLIFPSISELKHFVRGCPTYSERLIDYLLFHVSVSNMFDEKCYPLLLLFINELPDSLINKTIPGLLFHPAMPKTIDLHCRKVFYLLLAESPPITVKNFIEHILSEPSGFEFLVPSEKDWDDARRIAWSKVAVISSDYIDTINPEKNLTREQVLAEMKRVAIERSGLVHSLRGLACLSLRPNPEVPGSVFDTSTLCEEIGWYIAKGRLPLPAGESLNYRFYCGPVAPPLAAIAVPVEQCSSAEAEVVTETTSPTTPPAAGSASPAGLFGAEAAEEETKKEPPKP